MEKLKIGNMNVSFLSATRYHINGGILLMVIVLLAMIIANSPWGDAYAAFWNKEVHLQIGEFNLFSHNGNHMTLMNFINDALMTIFFFSVGLEIKRETLVGELSSFRQALLPIVAAYYLLLYDVGYGCREWFGYSDGNGYCFLPGGTKLIRQPCTYQSENISDGFCRGG